MILTVKNLNSGSLALLLARKRGLTLECKAIQEKCIHFHSEQYCPKAFSIEMKHSSVIPLREGLQQRQKAPCFWRLWGPSSDFSPTKPTRV